MVMKAPIHIGRIHLGEKALSILRCDQMIFGAVFYQDYRVCIVPVFAGFKRGPFRTEIAGAGILAGLQQTMKRHHPCEV